jgi:hypothetical protein
VALIGVILTVSGVALLIFRRPLTGLLTRMYSWHSERYPLLYPGPIRRLVQDPKWVRLGLFFVASAWIVIGVIEIAASFD